MINSQTNDTKTLELIKNALLDFNENDPYPVYVKAIAYDKILDIVSNHHAEKVFNKPTITPETRAL